MEHDGSPPIVKILLPLLAAVLLLTGACGASVENDKGQTKANTTALGEKSNKPSLSDDKRTSLPDRRPDIIGTITEVKRKDQGTNPFEWILVEEDPEIKASIGPNMEGSEKLYLEVTDETRIFTRRGDRGEITPATVTDFAKGQMVNAWHTGSVMESYPGHTGAREVVISPSQTRSTVFFPRQTLASVDSMTSQIRGKLTLDEEGCLHVEEPKYNIDSVPVWPADFEVDTSQDRVRILNKDGRVVGEVGQRVKLGGGQIPEEVLEGNDLIGKQALRELLERCPGGYWLVGAGAL